MINDTTMPYAQNRANATRHTYIVSNMGHVMVDCVLNRKNLDECLGLFAVVKPIKRIK